MSGTHTGNSQPSIDKEEHRSVNGVDAKAVVPYLFDGASLSPSMSAYKTMYDFDTNGTYIYIGEAAAGTATSAALWRIQKINLNTSGNPTSKLWADGVASFTKVWDNHTTFGYTV